MEEEYGEMKEMMGKASIHVFPHGGHPAILSNAEEFASIAQRISSRDMPSSIDAVIHLTTLKGGSYLTGLLYSYSVAVGIGLHTLCHS